MAPSRFAAAARGVNWVCFARLPLPGTRPGVRPGLNWVCLAQLHPRVGWGLPHRLPWAGGNWLCLYNRPARARGGRPQDGRPVAGLPQSAMLSPRTSIRGRNRRIGFVCTRAQPPGIGFVSHDGPVSHARGLKCWNTGTMGPPDGRDGRHRLGAPLRAIGFVCTTGPRGPEAAAWRGRPTAGLS